MTTPTDRPDPGLPEAVQRVMDHEDCTPCHDVLTKATFCETHLVGWLSDTDACARAEALARAARADYPDVRAQALRDAASSLRRIADHGADGEATPYETAEWLTAEADRIEGA